MPFNASGVFSRLFSWVADRDAGVQILASKMDDEMNGMAAAINSVTAGEVPLRGPMRTVNGTINAPAWSFTGDTDTGMYRAGEDTLGLAGGTGDLRVGPITLTYNGSSIMHEGMTSLEVGRGNTTAGARWVDFNVDGTTATDFNARIRRSAGADGILSIIQSGAGDVQINGGTAFTRDGASVWTDASNPVVQTNAVGSLGFFRNKTASTILYGTIVPGASLRAAGVNSNGSILEGGTPPGSWRCLGVASAEGATQFVRVS